MTVIEEIGTGVVFGLAAIAVLSFVAIAAATILVTCAVRLEERYNTLSGPPPTWFCALARRLMAVPDLSLRAGRPSAPVSAGVHWYGRSSTTSSPSVCPSTRPGTSALITCAHRHPSAPALFKTSCSSLPFCLPPISVSRRVTTQ